MASTIITMPDSGIERDQKVQQAVAEMNKLNLGSAARRLQALNETLSNTAQMGKLANVNLYSAFDPAEIEQRAVDEALREYSTLWSGFEWIRNVLVLVPITLTWFSFWLAAQDYGALLKARPELSGESFLYLWETGFAGQAAVPFLTFSQTALIAAFILLVIIFLTVLVHFRRDVGSTRAVNDAVKVRSDLEDALWEIEKALSARRRSDTDVGVAEDLHQAVTKFNVITDQMGKAVTQMDGGAREWMNITKEIDMRLGMVVGEMKDEAEGLRVFSNGLTGNVDKMFLNLESASQTSTRLSTAIERLSGSIQANTVVQEDKLNEIAAQLNVMEEQARGWGQALRKTTEDLRLAVDKSSNSAASATGAVATVTSVLKGQDELRSAMISLERSLSAMADSNNRGDGFNSGGGQLRSSLDMLTKMSGENAREQANLLSQIRNELNQSLRAFMSERTAVTQALTRTGTAPVQAQIKVAPLAFAIGVSVVAASIVVVGALYLLFSVFPR